MGDPWEPRTVPSPLPLASGSSLSPFFSLSHILSSEWGVPGAPNYVVPYCCRAVPEPGVPGCLHSSRASRRAASTSILRGSRAESRAGGFLAAPGPAPPPAPAANNGTVSLPDFRDPGEGKSLWSAVGCPVHLCALPVLACWPWRLQSWPGKPGPGPGQHLTAPHPTLDPARPGPRSYGQSSSVLGTLQLQTTDQAASPLVCLRVF